MPWRAIFFAVNFAASVLFVISCIVAVGESLNGAGSPYALGGGVCFVVPAAAYGLAEWLLYVRNVRRLERPLGVVCGVVGAMAVFAFVANAGEAMTTPTSGGPGVLAWGFAAACFGTAAYGFFCCWKRFTSDGTSRRGFTVRDA